nr:hypothetical protein Iba_chr05aCG3420 [Ipomoea batatas]
MWKSTFSCTFSMTDWFLATIVSVPSLTDIRAPVSSSIFLFRAPRGPINRRSAALLYFSVAKRGEYWSS